eukprot:TRINITY_DN6233_c0_g1_i1.p1 TRINITY_DN6233_c0_g1~~TRINITY_DN6233_c0_g1_i1.p1  ORF type:complete len:992 (+),score=222.27 TRINITY_DN6233_c0_g1_i1:323-3298(+)
METILEVLNVIISTPDNNLRTKKEHELNSFHKQSGFGVILCQILINTSNMNIALPIRQMAGLVLKMHVRDYWTEGNGFIISDADKQNIKDNIPKGLNLSDKQLRNTVAMVISTIAAWDWPEKWPNFIESLVDCLKSDNINLIDGTLDTLNHFTAGSKFTDDYAPVVISQTLPNLIMLLKHQQINDITKMKTVKFIYEVIEWIIIDSGGNTFKAMEPMLPELMVCFLNILQTQAQALQFHGVKIQVLQILQLLVGGFPGKFINYVNELLQPIWGMFTNFLTSYIELAIYSDKISEWFLEDLDIQAVGFEKLIVSNIEFICELLGKKRLRSLMEPHLEQLIYNVIGYLQLTESQRISYEEDPNQWVADENEDTFNFNIRITCRQLLEIIFNDFKAKAVAPFTQAVLKRLQEAESLKSQGTPFWWKMRESCIYAIGIVGPSLSKDQNFDAKQFSLSFLVPDIIDNFVYLKGRALWASSRIITNISEDEIRPFLEASVNCLNNPQETVAVKIFAVKSLANFVPKVPKEMMVIILDGIVSGILDFMDHVEGDTLYVVLEALNIFVPMSEQKAVGFMGNVVSRVLRVWANHFNDSYVANLMVDLISSLAKFPMCIDSLQDSLIPYLVTILNQYEERDIGVSETIIDMAAQLVNYSKTPLRESVWTLFPLLCQIMLTTEDGDQLTGGLSALKGYVRLGNLVEWKDPSSGITGLGLVLKVSERLLNPNMRDMAARSVGTLIDKIIFYYSDFLGSSVFSILDAVIERLKIAQISTLKQGLIMIFVRLFYVHTDQTLQYLQSKPYNENMNALTAIMNIWVKEHLSFSGKFKIKFSIVSMMVLFHKNLDILVEGDAPATTGRVTRSQAKNMVIEKIHLNQRIFQLMVREHMVVLENEMDGPSSYSDTVSDEEWAEADLSDFINSNDGAFTSESLFMDLLYDDMNYDEEEEDPDILKDPIYQVDLKEHIKEFMTALSKTENFMAYVNRLAPGEKKHLEDMFKS